MSAPRLFTFSLHIPGVPPPSEVLHPEDGSSTPLHSLMKETTAKNIYSSICIPIANDIWKHRWKEMCLVEHGMSSEGRKDSELQRVAEKWRAGHSGGFRKNEVNITRLEEAEGTIGMAADWLELDSPDAWVRYDSELALKQEISQASYLGIHTVILPPPRNRAHVTDYARAVNACLIAATGGSLYTHLSIRIPVYVPSITPLGNNSPCLQATSLPSASSLNSFGSIPGPSIPDADLNATWEMWDTIRTICDYSPRLSLTLDLTAPLPASAEPWMGRWSAEPARFIFLPASTFVPNSTGYPVLTKPTQEFFRSMASHRPTVILSNTTASLHVKGGPQAYPQYIRHLEKSSSMYKALESPDSVESFAQGYQDYLQAPLQPLMDNLQSFTYETFEKDPVKYRQYEEAVYQALIDRPEDSLIVICVAGAGRGGIVSRCLEAIKRSGRNCRLYALEKNPAASITLQERKDEEWGDAVSLVFGDMRTVQLPEPVDILVSELLGSFGDNELSPECLDGAMRFLKSDGISIPASYSSFLAPISSSKLWNDVAGVGKDRKIAETPYVVMFQSVNILSGGTQSEKFQEAWEFVHPRSDVLTDAIGLPVTNTHNVRSAHLTFHIPYAGILHGLAGYFETVLYDEVCLSIHPERMETICPNMLSWFPMFFPFKEPLYLPDNSELEVSIWRLTTKQKVWYEWSAEAFLNILSGNGVNRRLSTPLSSPIRTSPSVNSSLHGVDAADSDEARSVLRVKIGQTTLHNAGGQSSWVGL
ncbi:PRMT5 arginine-N-methyltransferase-domain-containing protein [Cantharellus anzutake]|uniref:PRMT5 arginine-N-methyltransferase-domain-containing protein n=1 Tax=Cantharellus anzutake TaxID=1750568 RepID=UPI001903ED8C|nr:PRMT5 arginine-N-methyltransferase-domain-containing protein [Cantharellus anzutake]KAF8340642.1 PRMT5 arginine-N-methyltransferase-domain-containing protein [Cantharellus anzutake]